MDALQPERAERIELGATSVRVLIPADLTNGATSAMRSSDRPRDAAAARELERRYGLDLTPDP